MTTAFPVFADASISLTSLARGRTRLTLFYQTETLFKRRYKRMHYFGPLFIKLGTYTRHL